MKAQKKSASPILGKRVLIVEDDVIQLDILKEVFLQEGFQVETATDGRAALQLIETNRPDLIVLDAVLPHFDGMRLMSLLTRTAPPVLLITGYEHIKGTAAYENGATVVFRKPLDMEELVAAAKRHVGGFSQGPAEGIPVLTEREKQVLKLIADGHSTREVAKLLNISDQTVFVFRKNIKRKFGGLSFIQICAKYRG